MRGRLIAAAALASVAGIVATANGGGGGGGGSFAHESFNAGDQQTATTGGSVQTNARQFKRIPGAAPVFPSSEPDGTDWLDSLTVTVMVVLKSGQGKLRVIDGPDGLPPFVNEREGDPMYPRSVSIKGKGPHTVQFILNEGWDLVFPPEPQWKRTGNAPLKAKTVVTSIQGNID
jgi:hypothetical protein